MDAFAVAGHNHSAGLSNRTIFVACSSRIATNVCRNSLVEKVFLGTGICNKVYWGNCVVGGVATLGLAGVVKRRARGAGSRDLPQVGKK